MTQTTTHTLQNEKDPAFQIWHQILKHSPTKTWQRPVLTFIETMLKPALDENPTGLTKYEIERCNDFMWNIARYIYAKSFANEPNGGLTIQQEMSYATSIAKRGRMYEPRLMITKDFRLSKQFEQKLKGDIPKNVQWGFCAVAEFSREFDETMKRIASLKPQKTISQILETAVIGQIFPNQWDSDFPNKLNKWNNKRIEKSLQTIGNLVLIEKDIYKNTNKIHTGNFFAKKRNPETGKGYKNSVFNEVSFYDTNHIDDQFQIEWLYGFWKIRQEQCIKCLIDFFSGLSKCIIY